MDQSCCTTKEYELSLLSPQRDDLSAVLNKPEKISASVTNISDYRTEELHKKFMACGAEAMPDCDLLELILHRAVPHQDVKTLAQRLVSIFGDLGRIFSASEARLNSIEGIVPAAVTELKIIATSAKRMARGKIMQRPILSCWDALLDYCHTVMGHAVTEEFRVLFLDRKNVLIADEVLARGTVDHVTVYPREILRRALELGASSLILVHNHPSGNPTPSEADIMMTHRIKMGAEIMGITIHDHLVIGTGCEVSFRQKNLL